MITVSTSYSLAVAELEQPTVAPLTEPTAPSGSALLSIAGRQLLVAVRLLIAMTIILGIAYPLVVFGIAQVIAPRRPTARWSARTGRRSAPA